MARTPVLFVSHGSPMFALQPGRIGPVLHALGRQLAGVQAVLVVSPHWQTRELQVGSASTPATVHDFGGFPPALYRLQYPAPGAPAQARRTIDRLRAAGYRVEEAPTRGLDHGAWVPLRHLLPEAALPVFQLSMPHDLGPATALRLGQALQPLRNEGVLLVASGSLTHNLSEFGSNVHDTDYANAFADWIADAIARDDHVALVDYRRRAPQAARAHPTEEHFLPLLIATGAADGEPALRLEGGLAEGTLSMDAYAWGLDPATRDALVAVTESVATSAPR